MQYMRHLTQDVRDRNIAIKINLIWEMLRRNKMKIKDTIQTKKISTEKWKIYDENHYNEHKSTVFMNFRF